MWRSGKEFTVHSLLFTVRIENAFTVNSRLSTVNLYHLSRARGEDDIPPVGRIVSQWCRVGMRPDSCGSLQQTPVRVFGIRGPACGKAEEAQPATNHFSVVPESVILPSLLAVNPPVYA